MYLINLINRIHQYTTAEYTSIYINVAFIIAGVVLGWWLCSKVGNDDSHKIRVLSIIEVCLVILTVASGAFSPIFNPHDHLIRTAREARVDVHMEKIGNSQHFHGLRKSQRSYLSHHKFRNLPKPRFTDYL